MSENNVQQPKELVLTSVKLTFSVLVEPDNEYRAMPIGGKVVVPLCKAIAEGLGLTGAYHVSLSQIKKEGPVVVAVR